MLLVPGICSVIVELVDAEVRRAYSFHKGVNIVLFRYVVQEVTSTVVAQNDASLTFAEDQPVACKSMKRFISKCTNDT